MAVKFLKREKSLSVCSKFGKLYMFICFRFEFVIFLKMRAFGRKGKSGKIRNFHNVNTKVFSLNAKKYEIFLFVLFKVVIFLRKRDEETNFLN